MSETDPMRAAILVFDDVEVLDFAGPYEVFSAARRGVEPGPNWSDAPKPFDVFTVAKSRATIDTTGGLRIEPTFAFDEVPPIDLLLVPGGRGVRAIVESSNDETLDWLRNVAGQAKLVTSVCTGAWVLAKAGLLANRRATTHFLCMDHLQDLDRSIQIQRDARVVEDGRTITAAGVSAGIDLALLIVARRCGRDAAANTARYIEYPWNLPGQA